MMKPGSKWLNDNIIMLQREHCDTNMEELKDCNPHCWSLYISSVWCEGSLCKFYTVREVIG